MRRNIIQSVPKVMLTRSRLSRPRLSVFGKILKRKLKFKMKYRSKYIFNLTKRLNLTLEYNLDRNAYFKLLIFDASLLEFLLNFAWVYKTVFIQHVAVTIRLKLKDNVQLWLNGALSDPVTKILAKNSQLTKTQLETLLIDVLAENLAGKPLKYDEKARLRLTKAKLSRGSFNRTLQQAKENVIRSIYTVLLLGYLGVFESTTLDPYLEIANKLKEYMEAHENLPSNLEAVDEHVRVIEIIRNELETSLKRHSDPSEREL